MSTEAVPMISYEEEKAVETLERPHLLAYGWIYVLFATLIALALFVMSTFPQGEV